jgi:pilus assembly protein CpaB
MGRRTLLLIAAMVVAAVGTTMVFLYVHGVNSRALKDQEPVRVVMAKKAISAGTSGADASAAAAFEVKEISKSSAAPGAISDIAPIADLVALAPIYPGEQILTSKFGESASSSALPIPDGKLAISVSLGDPARVAGYVGPGSTVAVFLSTTDKGRQTTQLLLPEVEVIAANGKTVVPDTATGDAAAAAPAPGALVTLAVDQEEYQKVLFATKAGELYFALMGKDAKPSLGVPGTTAENLFPTS